MSSGSISFVLNGKDMGVALQDQELKNGEFYPAVYTGQSEDKITISKNEYQYEHVEELSE